MWDNARPTRCGQLEAEAVDDVERLILLPVDFGRSKPDSSQVGSQHGHQVEGSASLQVDELCGG